MVCRAIELAAREHGLTHIGRLTANLLRPLPIAELEIEVTTDYSGRDAAGRPIDCSAPPIAPHIAVIEPSK